MTILTVAASYFTIPNGLFIIDKEIDISVVTLSQIKALIQDEFGPNTCSMDDQRLTWHGYVLDHEHKPLLESCKGLNKNEILCRNVDKLTIFLTMVRIEDELNEGDGSFNSNRDRNNSYEVRLSNGFRTPSKLRRETCAMS
ncbi:hypothetical protein ScalyP_jg3514 [Parmales sp. scaly parma]|nr:hypothetical protein ScalyP_jg3514 [Parmales sp. scaly parma]